MHGFVIHRHGINYLSVGVILLFSSQLTLEKTVFCDEARGTGEGHGVAEHVRVLADDTFEGREGGRRGGRAAGSYIEQQINPLGLIPAGSEGSCFQAFPTRFGTLRNILVMIPGSDAVLQNDVIVIGAHYDHVGYGNARNSFGPFGYIHNGADDNASGVAGLIEIVKKLASLPNPCRRTILIAFWDGEEQGLLGSKYFLNNRPSCIKGKKIIFSINLDMIGRLRNDQLSVFGARSAIGLETLITRINNRPKQKLVELVFNWKITPDSDHYPFLSANVPTVMFHTGLHPDYHRPSDDSHLVNFAGVKLVLNVAFQTLLQVANAADDIFKFRKEAFRESNDSRKKLESKAFLPINSRGRWGIGIRNDSANPESPVVVAIREGSPAERGGLQIKDRIYKVNGVAVAGQKELMKTLSGVPTHSGIDVVVSRRGQFLDLHWMD
ncbi:MAG: M20/M25/M40 family metallo-hydrolase [Betaproteobacteria bacterium]|nr:M20/M25/M40 family metallo-hydrolase [Betaproteobacteria bacterium]MBT6055849.1 M20/M25/M40 family metallo-hydrolase [Planctomycetaceae bacterium]